MAYSIEASGSGLNDLEIVGTITTPTITASASAGTGSRVPSGYTPPAVPVDENDTLPQSNPPSPIDWQAVGAYAALVYGAYTMNKAALALGAIGLFASMQSAAAKAPEPRTLIVDGRSNPAIAPGTYSIAAGVYA